MSLLIGVSSFVFGCFMLVSLVFFVFSLGSLFILGFLRVFTG